MSSFDTAFPLLPHVAADFAPKKADGETVPLLRETMTLIPVSMKGTEKSMTSERSSLMVKDPTAMWAFFNTTYERKKKHRSESAVICFWHLSSIHKDRTSI